MDHFSCLHWKMQKKQSERCWCFSASLNIRASNSSGEEMVVAECPPYHRPNKRICGCLLICNLRYLEEIVIRLLYTMNILNFKITVSFPPPHIKFMCSSNNVRDVLVFLTYLLKSPGLLHPHKYRYILVMLTWCTQSKNCKKIGANPLP